MLTACCSMALHTQVLTVTATSHMGEVFGPKEFPLQEQALLAGRCVE